MAGCVIDFLYRVTLDMIMLQDGRKIPWEERIPKGFFRGRDSNRARLDLVREHREHTDLFNVSLTQFFFHEYSQELYGDKVNRVPFLEFFKVRHDNYIQYMFYVYLFIQQIHFTKFYLLFSLSVYLSLSLSVQISTQYRWYSRCL